MAHMLFCKSAPDDNQKWNRPKRAPHLVIIKSAPPFCCLTDQREVNGFMQVTGQTEFNCKIPPPLDRLSSTAEPHLVIIKSAPHPL